ncbi:MAG: hypothetical protein ABIA04_11775 [Pseudomonadota bacterium]
MKKLIFSFISIMISMPIFVPEPIFAADDVEVICDVEYFEKSQEKDISIATISILDLDSLISEANDLLKLNEKLTKEEYGESANRLCLLVVKSNLTAYALDFKKENPKDLPITKDCLHHMGLSMFYAKVYVKVASTNAKFSKEREIIVNGQSPFPDVVNSFWSNQEYDKRTLGNLKFCEGSIPEWVFEK